MSNLFKENELDLEQFERLNLVKNGKITLGKENMKNLLSGKLTDDLHFNSVSIKDTKVNLSGKLSLNRDSSGAVKVFIYPNYNSRQYSSFLSHEENENFRDDRIETKNMAAYGKLKDFGAAPFEFNKENKESYFITLQKKNGEEKTIWGKELKAAIDKKGAKVGDNIQIEHKGLEPVKVNVEIKDKQGNVIGTKQVDTHRNNWEIHDLKDINKGYEKNIIFQYDKNSKTFVGVDAKVYDSIHSINGVLLEEEQKEALKKGKKIQLENDTEITPDITSKNGLFNSNKKFLVLSILLDGGMSFVLVKTAQKLSEKLDEREKRKLEIEHDKGYKEALNKLKAHLIEKQQAYPNDKTIERDIQIVSGELNKVNSIQTNTTQTVEKDNIKDLNVNDPDTFEDANRHQEEEKLEQTQEEQAQQQMKVEEEEVRTRKR